MKPDRPARRWRLRRDGAGLPAFRRLPGTGLAGPVVRWRLWRHRGVRAAAPYALVAGVVAVASLCGWVVLGSGVFGVRTVSVHGQRTVSAEDVARAAAIPVGTPLARLDTAAAAARIGRLPPIAAVRIHRSWPNTVVVEVTERTGAAVIPHGRSYLLVDADGVPFRTLPAAGGPPPGLPVIRVPAARPDDRATRAAITVAGALTPTLRQRTAAVTVVSERRIEVRLTDGRVVFWGDESDSSRKATVATALLGVAGRRIDVSTPHVATVR